MYALSYGPLIHQMLRAAGAIAALAVPQGDEREASSPNRAAGSNIHDCCARRRSRLRQRAQFTRHDMQRGFDLVAK